MYSVNTNQLACCGGQSNGPEMATMSGYMAKGSEGCSSADLKTGDYPRLSGWANGTTRILKSGRGGYDPGSRAKEIPCCWP